MKYQEPRIAVLHISMVHGKNHELLKTGLNNVVLPYCSMLSTTLFSIVTPDYRLDSVQA